MAAPSALPVSQRALRALELYNLATAERTEEALDAYLGCFHRDVELMSSASVVLAVSGVGELRAMIENLFAAEIAHQCRDMRVVSEERNRVVTHCTRVGFHDGLPFTEAEVEAEFVFDGELIVRMAARERGQPAVTPVAWAALGSTPSFTGEIVAHWSEEWPDRATASGSSRPGKVLVRLRDGREVELPCPAEAQGQWDVGDPVLVYFDGTAPLGWYLPDRQFGVDLRELGDR